MKSPIIDFIYLLIQWLLVAESNLLNISFFVQVGYLYFPLGKKNQVFFGFSDTPSTFPHQIICWCFHVLSKKKGFLVLQEIKRSFTSRKGRLYWHRLFIQTSWFGSRFQISTSFKYFGPTTVNIVLLNPNLLTSSRWMICRFKFIIGYMYWSSPFYSNPSCSRSMSSEFGSTT